MLKVVNPFAKGVPATFCSYAFLPHDSETSFRTTSWKHDHVGNLRGDR